MTLAGLAMLDTMIGRAEVAGARQKAHGGATTATQKQGRAANDGGDVGPAAQAAGVHYDTALAQGKGAP